jgi:pyridine nucleotide-disulfide oxidoreductase family protein
LREAMRLLLVGGGHSHVEVVRRFGIAPPRGAAITLASPARYAAYSGMLPGLVAGHYEFRDCHIDLEGLCRACGVSFRQSEVTGIDFSRHRASLGDGSEFEFDWLSLDIGSLPDSNGAAGQSLPVRPVAALLAGLDQLLAAARRSPQAVMIVGGGAGGVEIALAVHHRLQGIHAMPSTIGLVTDTDRILPTFPSAARRIFEGLLAKRGIRVYGGNRAVQAQTGTVHLENGIRIPADWILWITSARAAPWLAASGLAVDARGFVTVDDTLRSVSHSNVFAAGDCASLAGHPLPKSGVHAVRQGPQLAANLTSVLAGTPLKHYSPQRRALALISTGDRNAVACWGPLAFQGGWIWQWKDRIDRRFMATYRMGSGIA